MKPGELARKYDSFANWYDPILWITEVAGVGALRRLLLREAHGRVLEVAAGTGKNFPYYGRDCRILAADLSPNMLEIARQRARSVPVEFCLADTERLPFPEHAFDTVVSSFAACTFPDPVAAVREMARVCRKSGRVLMLEHGRSSIEPFGWWQDEFADFQARHLGCHWNREPLEIAQEAGLRVVRAGRLLFGVLHLLTLEPQR